MQLGFINEILAVKKDINNDDEIFCNYFKYVNLSLLAKDLIRGKNKKLVNNIDDDMIDLRKAIVIKQIPQKENLNKIVDIDNPRL